MRCCLHENRPDHKFRINKQIWQGFGVRDEKLNNSLWIFVGGPILLASRLDIVYLQYFVAVVVDYLDGDFVGFGRVEGTAPCRIQH